MTDRAEQRPEPTATAVMVIRTLTRIFTALSAERPTLTREMVTPHLPAFFAGLLAACERDGGDDVRVVAAALEALRDLVAAHPVTFRPFSGKTRAAVLKLLGGGGHDRLAREVFVRLHLCASKNSKRASGREGSKGDAVAEEWRDMFCAVLAEMHGTLDLVLKPVVEDHDCGHGSERSPATLGLAPLAAAAEEGDAAAKAERLLLLIRLLGTFFTTPTPAQPQIPLAQLMDATSRVLGVTAASATPSLAVERAHREGLLAVLPAIHAAAFNLLDTIAHRLQGLLLPFVQAMLEQAAWVLSEESWSADVRVAVYSLVNTLLAFSGPALSKATVGALHPVFLVCCDDLLPPRPPPAPRPAPASRKQAHADSLMSSAPARPFRPLALVAAAEQLLATTLAKVQPSLLRAEARAKLERTAVVTGNKEALLAAVLFPRTEARCGLLPHLVGNGVGIAEEALVRPRMPVVWTGPSRAEVRRLIEEAEETREEGWEGGEGGEGGGGGGGGEGGSEGGGGECEEASWGARHKTLVWIEEGEVEVGRRSAKRPRTEGEPSVPVCLPPPTTRVPPAAAAQPALSFFPQILAPAATGPPAAAISPEKAYPSLAPSIAPYHGLDDSVVIKQTSATAVPPASVAISPLKPFGDGSQQQLRKEEAAADEDGNSDSEMGEVPEIVLGDSDGSDDSDDDDDDDGGVK